MYTKFISGFNTHNPARHRQGTIFEAIWANSKVQELWHMDLHILCIYIEGKIQHLCIWGMFYFEGQVLIWGIRGMDKWMILFFEQLIHMKTLSSLWLNPWCCERTENNSGVKSVCLLLIASKTSADIKTHKILIFLPSDTIFAYTLIHYLKITHNAQDNANVVHTVVIVYCVRYDNKGETL